MVKTAHRHDLHIHTDCPMALTQRILVSVWLPYPECMRPQMASIDGRWREAITQLMEL